jgi:hypothetical protein
VKIVGLFSVAIGTPGKAIVALEQSISIALADGGTALDFVFLALAHARLRDWKQAHYWNFTSRGLDARPQLSPPGLVSTVQTGILSLSSLSGQSLTLTKDPLSITDGFYRAYVLAAAAPLSGNKEVTSDRLLKSANDRCTVGRREWSAKTNLEVTNPAQALQEWA